MTSCGMQLYGEKSTDSRERVADLFNNSPIIVDNIGECHCGSVVPGVRDEVLVASTSSGGF